MGDQERTEVRPSWGRRLSGVEGLRGIAATVVLASHVMLYATPGVSLGYGQFVAGQFGHGLTLFFALSGFLLYRPFAAGLLGTGPRPDARRFLRNRALRIFPANVVILLLASLALGTVFVRPVARDQAIAGSAATLGHMTDPLDLLANAALVHTYIPNFVRSGLGVTWSLTVEVAFYLLLPLLAILAGLLTRRVSPSLAVWLPVILLLTVGTAGKLWSARSLADVEDKAEMFALTWGDTWHAVVERSILVHGDLFAYGMAAAVLAALAEGNRIDLDRLRVAASAVALLVGAFVVLRPSWTFEKSAAAAACSGLILAAVLPVRGETTLIGRVLEFRPLRYLGLISYSMYLWHLPVLWWLDRRGLLFGDTPVRYLASVLITLGVVTALSSMTYAWIEAPALLRKQRTDTSGESQPALARRTAVR